MDETVKDPAINPSATPAGADAPPPTSEQVREALGVVIDPEIGLPITELGLVYDIAVADDGEVLVTYTLTTMGCPIGPMIDQQIQQIVSALPGVASVESKMTFSPPWTPEMMTEDAKAALGYF
jgi:metal-sulfur cluster biosynthetic enzyme